MIATLVIATILSATSTADDAGPTTERVRAAISKALPPIVKSVEEYPKHRDCFSCHHQAVPVFALTTARARGFDVKPETIAAAVEHTEADLRTDLDAYKKGNGQPGGVTRAGYALFTLEAGGKSPDEVTSAVAFFLRQRNASGDRWRTSSSRPPSEASDFTSTYLALRALAVYGQTSPKSRSRSASKRRAVGSKRRRPKTPRTASSGCLRFVKARHRTRRSARPPTPCSPRSATTAGGPSSTAARPTPTRPARRSSPYTTRANSRPTTRATDAACASSSPASAPTAPGSSTRAASRFSRISRAVSRTAKINSSRWPRVLGRSPRSCSLVRSPDLADLKVSVSPRASVLPPGLRLHSIQHASARSCAGLNDFGR